MIGEKYSNFSRIQTMASSQFENVTLIDQKRLAYSKLDDQIGN